MIETKEDAKMACLKYGIPEHMHDAVEAYVVGHHECGGFFMALMENDFMLCAAKADRRNLAALGDWAKLIYNEFPIACWGSPAKVEKWLASKPAKETT